MIRKLLDIYRRYEDVISYLFFGVLTTVVNYLVYLPCYYWLHLSGSVSNAIAWVVAVTFAYLTNKPFVFKSHDWSAKTVFPAIKTAGACAAVSLPMVSALTAGAGMKKSRTDCEADLSAQNASAEMHPEGMGSRRDAIAA